MSTRLEAGFPQKQTHTTRTSPFQIQFLAAIFFILGSAVLLALFYLISQNTDVVGPGVPDFNTRAWNFLQAFGLIRPILAIIGGLWLIRLGLRLRSGHVTPARWARTILIWLIVTSGLVVVFVINRNLSTESAAGEPLGSDFVITLLPWGALLLLLITGYVVLNRSMALFWGDEDIVIIRTRMAWNLLAPTLIIFLAIGISPLEQVFLTSLTNEEFASSAEVEYIGFENYTRLLGIRIDRLPCETDESTGDCLTQIDENGNETIVYPGARRWLRDNVIGYQFDEAGNNLGDLAFRPYNEFQLFGTYYVLSARDTEFIDATITSIIYSVVAIFLQLVLGLGVAMLLAQKMRGMGPLRVALLIPMAIPTLIATQFWDIMLAEDATGLANSVLLNLGIIDQAQQWFAEPNWQLPAIILVIVWKETPPMALLLLPGLTAISPEIYQAASVDGANRWQTFFRITLPILSPTIGIALVLRTIIALRAFDIFHVLLGERRFSLATYAHNVLTLRQDLGYSSAISVAIFVILLIFSIIYMRTLKVDQS